jgi:glucan 1,3-beta-glucosidase
MPYQNATPRAIDEYTLSQALGDDLADYMIAHYETFITERDFADIAAAGMNWIRLPVPFWIVETVETEPYLEGVAWNYMLQAFGKSGLTSLRQISAIRGTNIVHRMGA